MNFLRYGCLILALLLLPSALRAQKQNNVWYFGYGAGIDFNGPVPVSIAGGLINTYEGCASIADHRTGKLLFYTDGVTIWNRNNIPMSPGQPLLGHNSSTQSALIVPTPGDSTKYYVFTTDAIDNNLGNGLRYSIVDMRLNSGFGDVTARNTPLITPVTERQTAIPSCNGRYYWVLAHGFGDNRFYAYRITSLGVDPPVVSATGIVDGPSQNFAIGYMKASPDGKRLAVASTSLVQLFDFDASTGTVSNPITIQSPVASTICYGLCFSPDDSKLYIGEYFQGIFQYDLTSGNQAAIVASRFETMPRDPDNSIGALQLGPDGRIYCSVYNQDALGIISNPNGLGAAAVFTYGGFPLTYGRSSLGLPNLIDAYSPELNGATAGPDLTVCGGGIVVLHASGGSSYQWSPTAGLNCATCPDPIARPTVTTTYTVTISNGGACPFVDSVTVFVRPAAIVDAGADRSICTGGSTTLTSTPGATYLWSPAAGLSCTDCRSPKATPATSTTYTVTITDANGCSATDSVRVDVHGPTPHALGNDTTICSGNSVQLHASRGTAWTWTPAAGLSCTNCRNPTASPAQTTTYTVMVTDSGGCTGTDSIKVIVAPPLTADAGNDTSICRGASAMLHASNGRSWRWSPATGLSCVDCADPVATPLQTTTYHLEIGGSGGCTATDSVTVTVIPTPAADAGSDTTICAGTSIRLHASDGISWQWSPSLGLSCADCRDPVASPAVTTIYRLEVMNAGGCPSIDSILVTVAPHPVADAGRDTTICIGGNVALNASDGTAWRWSPAAGLSCVDCRRPTASPSGTTTYHLEVFGGAGCSAMDSVTVMVVPPPIAGAGADTTICAGTGAVLHATGGASYRWSPAAGLSCTDCADPVASPAISTRYHLTAIGAGGCSSADSVFVSVLPAPVVDAGHDTAICESDTIQLHASGGISYRWSPRLGLSCADCPDPIASPGRTTTYVVTSASFNGCEGIDSITVFTHPSRLLHAHIPRDLHLLPGDRLTVPILIDDPLALATFSDFVLRLGYRTSIIRHRGFVTSRTATDGWRIDTLADSAGIISIHGIRPPGMPAEASDTLLLFQIDGFVGDTVYSRLPFTLRLGDSSCTFVETTPGLVHIDSICGLSQRLIEPITGAYALKQNSPNPFSPATTIIFSLGLDGPTTLTVTNERGNAVATLIDGYMKPGTYSVVWDASAMPSGIYYYRLASGDWMETKVMMVMR
ncbi:MAG: hypothetical protein JWQ98_3404 [Chlorobi bacterium]|nr:hypothetical protein [Chlorobiota bacterium]